MEKLLELEDGTFYRFQCECLSPEDAMDVEVNEYGISFLMQYEPVKFSQRIKDAFNVLRGRFCWREFILREEDRAELRKILK